MEDTGMKAYRLTCLFSLVVLVFIGLISIPFIPAIEAALKVTWKQPYGMAMTTSHAPAKKTAMMAQPNSMLTAANPGVLASDTFQRADHLFWGMASDGQLWGADANNNPSFMITNHMGRIMNGNGIYNASLGPRATDSDVVFSGLLSSFLQGSNLGAVLRWQDTNNWYKAYIEGTQLILIKDVAGTITVLNAVPFPTHANTFYTLRFRIVGSQLMARVWPVGQVEPTNWMVKGTDNAISSGFGGLRLVVMAGAEATFTMFAESRVTGP
jgi:hypothetical protein